MTVHSMTAYARETHTGAQLQWTWELKSVNHRFLECQVRLPESHRHLEIALRNRLKKTLDRGKVDITLQVGANEGSNTLNFDPPAVSQLFKAINQLQQLSPASVSPIQITLSDLLKWPGLIRTGNSMDEPDSEDLFKTFDQTLMLLKEQRAREGQALKEAIVERLPSVRSIIESLKTSIPEIINQQQVKLEQRISEIKTELQPDRLAQELIIYAQKIDIAEEIDRIATHIDEIEQILNKGGCVGRRLDFLMQELNREANTVGSKSVHIHSSQSAVNLKVLIEQMREQVQNIE